MNITELFDHTYKKAQEVQREEQDGKTVDGRAVWQKIEAEVSHITETKLKYEEEKLKKIYPEMDKLIKKYKMDESEYDPKSNHFFMQLKNLVVKKSEPPGSYNLYLNRLLQLAYNAGQLSVFMENKKLPDDVVQFVNDHQLLKLDTYVSKETRGEINKLLKEKQQSGGNYYYHQYRMYKQKYLQARALAK